jgi:hypothetical protein
MGSLKYVRKHYGLNVHRGTRVRTFKGEGRVTSGTNYVHVLIDGEKKPMGFHPQDVELKKQCGNCGLHHFSNTECELQPEDGSRWVFRPLKGVAETK